MSALPLLNQQLRAEVAQLVEHSPEKAGVDSSILSLGTTSFSETYRNTTFVPDSKSGLFSLALDCLSKSFLGGPGRMELGAARGAESPHRLEEA